MFFCRVRWSVYLRCFGVLEGYSGCLKDEAGGLAEYPDSSEEDLGVLCCLERDLGSPLGLEEGPGFFKEDLGDVDDDGGGLIDVEDDVGGLDEDPGIFEEDLGGIVGLDEYPGGLEDGVGCPFGIGEDAGSLAFNPNSVEEVLGGFCIFEEDLGSPVVLEEDPSGFEEAFGGFDIVAVEGCWYLSKHAPLGTNMWDIRAS